METVAAIISLLGVGALVSFLFSNRKRGKEESQSPPSNNTADIARGAVRQTFEEEVEGLWDDLEGDDPAGDLADRGNARSRR